MKWISKFIHADVVFGAIFVFGLLFAVSKIFSNVNTDIVDPIGKALSDFELTDIVYTAMRDEPAKDTNITLVNIGNLSRGDIGRLIMNLNKYDPKVIGIDTRFLKDKTPYYLENGLEDGDSVLALSFKQTKNLVLVTDMKRDSTGIVNSITTSHPKFSQYANAAFANMITSEKDFRVAREILSKEKAFGKTEVFFPVKTASFFDSTKAAKFIKRDRELETIYYRGNINNFNGDLDQFGKGDAFNKIDVQEGMDGSFDPKLVKGKILMMGYMGDVIKNDKYWDEDKFYTPLNKKYAGKSYPDMYGVIVHANVVSMILNETYIDDLDGDISIAINIFLCLMAVIVFSYIHHNIHLWWDGLSVVVMLAMLIAVFMANLYVFMKYRIVMDTSFSVYFLFVLGNFLELYYEYAKPWFMWILKKRASISLAKN